MTALVAKLLPPEIDRRGIGAITFSDDAAAERGGVAVKDEAS